MSKIAAYREARARADKVRRKLTAALGRDRSDNDKHALYAKLDGIDKHYWGEAIVRIHASYGYYGSSSGYRAMDENVAEYMVRAINEYMVQIAERAMELADMDAEEARREAEDEAREVLREIGQG